MFTESLIRMGYGIQGRCLCSAEVLGSGCCCPGWIFIKIKGDIIVL